MYKKKQTNNVLANIFSVNNATAKKSGNLKDRFSSRTTFLLMAENNRGLKY